MIGPGIVAVSISAAPIAIALVLFWQICTEIGRDNSFCHKIFPRRRLYAIIGASTPRRTTLHDRTSLCPEGGDQKYAAQRGRQAAGDSSRRSRVRDRTWHFRAVNFTPLRRQTWAMAPPSISQRAGEKVSATQSARAPLVMKTSPVATRPTSRWRQ